MLIVIAEHCHSVSFLMLCLDMSMLMISNIPLKGAIKYVVSFQRPPFTFIIGIEYW